MKTYLKKFDWILLSGLLVLAVSSLTSLFSSNFELFSRQLIWFALAFVVILAGTLLPWRRLIGQSHFRYGLYVLSILFLIISNLQVGTIRGVKSWLQLGNFQFEPVELVKVALIFLFAGFFSKRYLAAWVGRNIALSFIYAFIPAVLVALHPDFGSAIVILGIWIGFLFASGINKKRLMAGIIIAILFFALLWIFFLKPYQKDRILGFINPQSDPLGVNYNVIQSKIAIGSAGIWGKGFQGGTQTLLNFLPEAETDFLFAAFTEEWGIFGGGVVILAFGLVIFRILGIGTRAVNNDSKFIALGSALVMVIHFFLNLGSNLGIMPVTGINFPFLSYGGSNLLTVAILVSIIERINLESR